MEELTAIITVPFKAISLTHYRIGDVVSYEIDDNTVYIIGDSNVRVGMIGFSTSQFIIALLKIDGNRIEIHRTKPYTLEIYLYERSDRS